MERDRFGRAFEVTVEARRDIGAELVFHPAKFASLGGHDTAGDLAAIYARNAKRFAPDSEFAGAVASLRGGSEDR